MRSSWQSQMVCLGQALIMGHVRTIVQSLCKEWVSGIKSEQANNVNSVQAGWEGHTVRSVNEYYCILGNICAMICYNRLSVKRSMAAFCVCNELGKLEKRYLLCCYFAE